MPALLIRLTVNLAGPAMAYVLMRPHLHSGITALVAGAAVPVAYTAGIWLWRRRLDAIGVFAIVCFAIGLLLVVATGGNELVFKTPGRHLERAPRAGLPDLRGRAPARCSSWCCDSRPAAIPTAPSWLAPRRYAGYQP